MLNIMKNLRKAISQRATVFMTPLMIGFLSAVATAQTPAPPPKLQRVPPVWHGLLVMFLLLAIVMAVSLMPSKRSHQD